ESAIGLGLIGTDITLEGPFKKGYRGSFLFNYRYSTASLVQDIGLINVDGLFNFQDANFKIVLPTKKIGTFSVFGVGGMSGYYVDDYAINMLGTPTSRTNSIELQEDAEKENYLLNTGLNHILTINESSFIKTSISYSGNGIRDDMFKSENIGTINTLGEFIVDSIVNKSLSLKNRLYKSTYRGNVMYSNKINTHNKIKIGIKYTIHIYDYLQSYLPEDAKTLFTVVDFNENVATLQNYISWKYRLNENITIVSGIHNMNVLINNKSTLEPRIAVNWKINRTNSVHIGYGNHSTMESIHHYYTKVEQVDGSVVEPNTDLDLLKAHHYVVGYEKRFNGNFMAKVELYYQYIYNIPVEDVDTSYFATINEGLDYRYVDLVNEGTGKNYGVEVTFERFFANDYFFLVNASLFNSTYKSLEGMERNTMYNKKYLGNILYGKEFQNLGQNKNKTLAINSKLFIQGGQRFTPLLRDDDGNLIVDPENNRFWDYEQAYEAYLDNVYQINVSISYKINKLKATHEIFLDLQNLTNYKGRTYEYYDESEPGNIGYASQFGFFPNLMYRVYF
ncbi:TonB-dependent receptor, partial [Bacteroidota bacterium]